MKEKRLEETKYQPFLTKNVLTSNKYAYPYKDVFLTTTFLYDRHILTMTAAYLFPGDLEDPCMLARLLSGSRHSNRELASLLSPR